jgi:molybdopterin-binding protein
MSCIGGPQDQANEQVDYARGEAAMRLSARNQLPGVVKSVKLGNVMAEVVVDIAGHDVVSAITRASAETLNLQQGKQVTVIIKSTEVMLATD